MGVTPEQIRQVLEKEQSAEQANRGGPQPAAREEGGPVPREVIRSRLQQGRTGPDQTQQARQPAQAPSPQPQQERSLVDSIFNPQSLRGAAVTAGSLIGGALGTPAGPAGIAGGAALGSAIGSLGFDSALDLLNEFNVRDVPPPSSVTDRLTTASNEAALDVIFGAGGEVLRGGKGALASFIGVKPQGIQLAKQAEELGVKLGPTQTAEGGLAGFFPKVLARFPLIGGPLREQAKRVTKDALDAQERLLVRVGPTASMADLGFDMNRLADKKFGQFRRIINKKYEKAMNLASKRNTVVPTTSFRGQARQSLLDVMEKRGEIDTKNPAVKFLAKYAGVPSELLEQTPAPGPEAIVRAMDTAEQQGIQNTVKLKRFDGILEELDEAMTRSRNNGFQLNELRQAKTAAEEDFKNINDPEVARAFKDADRTFTKMMAELFETPTAQRFGRVQKNRFRVGLTKQGTRNPDETFRAVWNAESPKAMSDLRRLVGEKKFKEALSTEMTATFRKALSAGEESARRGEGGGGIDLDVIRRQFGLNDVNSSRFAAFDEALKGTNVTPSEVDNLLNVVKAAVDSAPDSVNAFIARRGTLGGFRSILGALLPAASAGGAAGGVLGGPGNILTGIGATVLARQFGSVISSPRTMKLIEKAMNPSTSNQFKRRALLGAIRGMNPDAGNTVNAIGQALGVDPQEALNQRQQERPAQGAR